MIRPHCRYDRMGGAAVLALILLAPVSTGAQQSRADQDLERVLRAALLRIERVGDGRFEVEVADGVAYVDGWATDLHGKWDALEIVAKVQGIVGIDERIELRSRGANTGLEGRVRRRIADVPRLSSARLVVSARGGVVTLAGELADAQDRQRAREAAADVDGVTDVLDEMRSPPQSDSKIADDVREVVGPRSVSGIAGRIEVTAVDGVVTLNGEVKTLFAQVQAERLAHSVNGVVAVQNHLRLVPR